MKWLRQHRARVELVIYAEQTRVLFDRRAAAQLFVLATISIFSSPRRERAFAPACSAGVAQAISSQLVSGYERAERVDKSLQTAVLAGADNRPRQIPFSRPTAQDAQEPLIGALFREGA